MLNYPAVVRVRFGQSSLRGLCGFVKHFRGAKYHRAAQSFEQSELAFLLAVHLRVVSGRNPQIDQATRRGLLHSVVREFIITICGVCNAALYTTVVLVKGADL